MEGMQLQENTRAASPNPNHRRARAGSQPATWASSVVLEVQAQDNGAVHTLCSTNKGGAAIVHGRGSHPFANQGPLKHMGACCLAP